MDSNLNTYVNNVNMQNAQVQVRPVEVIEHKKVYRIAAWISYLIGFFYLKHVIISTFKFEADSKPYMLWTYFVFGVVFVIATEIFSHFAGMEYKKLKEAKKSVVEPIVFIACIALQSVAIMIWGFHKEWEVYQFLLWHFMIIYYVLARTGCLAAGRSGLLFFLDGIQGTVTVPWSYIFFRTETILRKGCMFEPKPAKVKGAVKERKKLSLTTIVTVGISVCIALIVCGYAVVQLAASSDTFSNLGSAVVEVIDNFFESLFKVFDEDFFYEVESNIGTFLFSIPISCWLFGLVGGCIRKKKPMCSDKEFEDCTKDLHLLPSYSAYIVIGSVCVVYALFCGTAVYDFIFHKGFFAATAHEASVRSVESFWSLIRVVVMNFTVVAASCLFSKKALWEEKGTRILGTVLVAFALIFAILAACNLCGVYISLFGITPKRILSSLVVFNAIAWCILMLIRFYKKIPAAQIGILIGAISFSVVVCFKF